jgi:hypothetical protein
VLDGVFVRGVDGRLQFAEIDPPGHADQTLRRTRPVRSALPPEL